MPDVCDEDAVNRLFDGAAEAYGRIDIAFNNAGIYHRGQSDRKHRIAAAGDGYKTSAT